MIGATLLCILIPLVIYGFILLRKKRLYFLERKMKYLQPHFLLGNSTDAVLGRLHPTEVIDRLYKSFPDEEVVGHYELFIPMMVVRSPELVDSVLVKEFSSFHDRLPFDDEMPIDSPIDANLFILGGNRWRALRSKFSPLFTSGKLKFMYPTMADCGNNLIKVLDGKSGEEVEMSDMLGLFSMDVIGSTAFGLEPNVLQNPESKFWIMGKKIFEGSFLINIGTMINVMFPKVAKFFNISGFRNKEVSYYFFNIIRDAMRHRKEGSFERNDFVQMLLTLKEKGKIEVKMREKGDEYLMMDEDNSDKYELELTDDILVGGAFTFLSAGFHATAMTLAYTLFELSQKPNVLEKLKEEIRVNLKGDEPTYEDLKMLTYLDKVLKESMRLHPTAGVLTRMCTKKFTSPGGFDFNVGDRVQIPAYSIMRDPVYWPEPEVFNPDRFDTPPKPGTYLPFGDGPRICIAMRFAMVEMKYILVKLLTEYHFQLSEKTELPLKIVPRMFLTTPKGGITFHVTKIKK